MIHDGEDVLLVDVSLCLNAARSTRWLRESKTVIMAVGYLEVSKVRTCARAAATAAAWRVP